MHNGLSRRRAEQAYSAEDQRVLRFVYPHQEICR